MKYFLTCTSPKVITNPYTHEVMSVPCGHCDACKMKNAFSWSQRIEHECVSSRYSLFFTLTYDNAHLPVLSWHGLSQTYCYVNNIVSLYHRPFEYGECISLSDLGHLSKKDFNYVLDTPELAVLSKRHIQLFVKRLRKLFSKIDYEEKQVRYFICGEYGPTTFRPHYHGILWFSSAKAAEKIREIISACWKYGFIDTSFVRSTCANYVASYVNCISYLPAIYSHKSIKPFFLCSKRPPIGSYYSSVAEIPQKVLVSDTTFKGFSKYGSESVDVPLWRFAQDSLYPRLPKFDKLSHNGRVALYGCTNYDSFDSWYDFRAWLKSQVSSYDTYFTRYLSCNGIYSYGTILSESMHKQEINFTKRLYSISRKVLFNCSYLGICLSDYVTAIEEYYHQKEIRKLSEWYRFQQSYIDSGGSLRDLIFCDSAFLKRVINPVSIDLILKSYGYDSLSEFMAVDLTKQPFYKDFKEFYCKLANDSYKVKKLNDKIGILNNPLYLSQFNYHFYA